MAFAEAYGGPLTWEEVLDLAAFVRSWGLVAPPSEADAVGGPIYSGTIGPLLTEGAADIAKMWESYGGKPAKDAMQMFEGLTLDTIDAYYWGQYHPIKRR